MHGIQQTCIPFVRHIHAPTALINHMRSTHTHTHSQRRGSSVAWNPEVATQLLVASEDDGTPSLQLWDLRYSMAPVKELLGHTKVGVVTSLQWRVDVLSHTE